MHKLFYLLLLIGVLVSCSSNDQSEKDNKKKPIPIHRPDKPQPIFVPINVVYNPKKQYSKKDLNTLTQVELNLLRVQIYDRNDYEFESIWKRNFYKQKYGYIIKPNYNKLDFNKLDKENDFLIVKVIEQKRKKDKRYNRLPIYTGHILREVNLKSNLIRYFLSIKDKKAIPFNKDEIPVGISQPVLGREISKKSWKELISGRKTFRDLGLPEDQTIIYIVKYHYNKKIRYIISFEAYGGKLSYQDCKNFSLYDRDGILRRNIYLVGNQELYERDYMYNDVGDVVKIVEKISQNNQLSRVNIFKRNPKIYKPGREEYSTYEK